MTFDPTTPSAELPTPPRDPYDMTHSEEAPQGPVDPENGSEDAHDEPLPEVPENPKRIGLTIARELDKRVRVMVERQASFEELLRQLGVVDPNQQAAGLRNMYVQALGISKGIDKDLERLKGLTNEVLQTLEAL